MRAVYRKYVLISIPLLIIHAAEEYFLGFYSVDSSVRFLAKILHATPLIALIIVHVLLAVFLLSLLLKEYRAGLLLLGLILVFEIHHPLEGLLIKGYYPGLATSIPLIVLGILFWDKFYGTEVEYRQADNR